MDLDAVLAACGSNDNTVQKQAEQTITAAAKSPEILSQLMQRLQSAEQPQVSCFSSTLRTSDALITALCIQQYIAAHKLPVQCTVDV